VNKVVQVYVNRQVFVNANGDRLDQRKVIEHNLIALFLRLLGFAGFGHTGGSHVFRPLFQTFLCAACLADASKIAARVPLSFL
jgi:hypothetical protein